MALFLADGNPIPSPAYLRANADVLEGTTTVIFSEKGTYYFRVEDPLVGEQFALLSDVSIVEFPESGVIQNVTATAGILLYQVTKENTLFQNSASIAEADSILAGQFPNYQNNSQFDRLIVAPGQSDPHYVREFYLAVSGDPDLFQTVFGSLGLKAPDAGRALITRGTITGERDFAWGNWLDVIKWASSENPPGTDVENRVNETPDWVLDLPETLDFSHDQDGYNGISSPLYDILPDGTWVAPGIDLSELLDPARRTVRDLFDVIGASTTDAVLEEIIEAGGELGTYASLARDSVSVRKILTAAVSRTFEAFKQGADGVVGKNDLDTRSFGRIVVESVDKSQRDFRDYVEGKLGAIGGAVHDSLSGKVYSLREVNSFQAVLYDNTSVARGGSKSDSFLGTTSTDIFLLTEGGDIIFSRGGRDVFILDDKYDGSILFGGEGIDRIVTPYQSSDFSIQTNGIKVWLTGSQGTVNAFDVERIQFADRTIAFDIDEHAGQAYRIYQAAFNRTPDESGLSYWVNFLDAGNTLRGVAERFIDSDEFRTLYGANTSDTAFVQKLYENILQRPGDQEGITYWESRLAQGENRAVVLSEFAESPENKAQVLPRIESGIWYNNDTIAVDGPNPNLLVGSSANDTFNISVEKAIVYGAAGDDTFRIATPTYTLELHGGAGLDRLAFDHPSDSHTVTRQYGAVRIAGPNGEVIAAEIERLDFSNGTLALDIDGAAGQAYRLYEAAFNRTPDIPGLTYWVERLDAGASLTGIAGEFIGTLEFAAVYGDNVSNEDFIARLYRNILDREGDEGGISFWSDQLRYHTKSRAEVLAGFSESNENIIGVAPRIESGIWLE